MSKVMAGVHLLTSGGLPNEMRRVVEQQTLAIIIRRNTTIGDELQDNIFLATDAPAEIPHLESNQRPTRVNRDVESSRRTENFIVTGKTSPVSSLTASAGLRSIALIS